jgi:hypothetical protein
MLKETVLDAATDNYDKSLEHQIVALYLVSRDSMHSITRLPLGVVIVVLD